MPAITRCTKVSAETRKVIEELIWVFGLPEDCVLIAYPDGKLSIDNEKRGRILEISVDKSLPPQFPDQGIS
jgi:hypothetical protein